MNREIKFRAWDSVHNKMIYLKDVASYGYANEFDLYEISDFEVIGNIYENEVD